MGLAASCSRRCREPQLEPEPELESDSSDWEAVGHTTDSEHFSRVAPTAEDILRRDLAGGFRVYCVWTIRGNTDLAGIHWGYGSTAYSGILQTNGGHLGGISWKREASVEAAQARFKAEAGSKGVSSAKADCFFRWP